MATSREEFMRQMGISNDDISKPEEYVPPPRKERTTTTTTMSSSASPMASSNTNTATTLRSKNSNTSSSAASSSAQQDYYELKRQREQQQQAQQTYESSYSTPSSKQPTASTSNNHMPSGSVSGQQSAASRAEFLRSLGIDNANQESAPAGTSKLRGTDEEAQQVEREQRHQAAYTSASVRSALRRSEINAEEEAHNSPSTANNNNYGPRSSVPSASSGLNASTNSNILDSSYTSQRAASGGLNRRNSSTGSLNSSMNRMDSSFTTSSSATTLLDINGVEVPIDSTADDLKKHGNKFYEAGDFRKAVRFYSRSIDKDPSNQVLFSNRSAAYLLASKQMALDTRTMALRDADKCIELKPTWFKGYSRRGDALFKLERFEEACDAYRAALERDPGNEAIMSSLDQCKACCGPQKDNSFAWSQPKDYHHATGRTSSSLNNTSRSSVGGGGGLDSSKSAHELLDEFRVASTRATGGSVSAADYREQQLAKFREQRGGGGGSTNSSASRSMNNNNNNNNNANDSSAMMNDSYSSSSGAGQQHQSNTSSASTINPNQDLASTMAQNPAYNSEAAANYQNSLLEAYRRKKAMGK